MSQPPQKAPPQSAKPQTSPAQPPQKAQTTAQQAKTENTQKSTAQGNMGSDEATKKQAPPSRENDLFYLKLQWTAAKDEAERNRLGFKIQELLKKNRASSPTATPRAPTAEQLKPKETTPKGPAEKSQPAAAPKQSPNQSKEKPASPTNAKIETNQSKALTELSSQKPENEPPSTTPSPASPTTAKPANPQKQPPKTLPAALEKLSNDELETLAQEILTVAHSRKENQKSE